ncbi:MAG: hypothetical protein K2X93_16975 [Candidatus Obscuribacterales bacterium]|nr:hypothetical protein [Candidatus Obscuribacterales bacterium]
MSEEIVGAKHRIEIEEVAAASEETEPGSTQHRDDVSNYAPYDVDEVVFGLSKDLEAPNIVLRPSPLRRLTAMIFDGALLGIISLFLLLAIAVSLEPLFPHGTWVRSLIMLGMVQISGMEFFMWEAFGFFSSRCFVQCF